MRKKFVPRKAIFVLGGIIVVTTLICAFTYRLGGFRIHPCDKIFNFQSHISQLHLLDNVSGRFETDGENASDTYYNEKYWEWQKQMNEFGGTFKGEIILASMERNSGNIVILEFGSSGGFIIEFIRQNVEASTAIGVEINPAARDHSRKRFPDVGVVSRTSSIPSASVDFVYTTSVLEHVDCPVCELREFRRVLKPTGELFVMVRGEGVSREQDTYTANDINNHLYTWTALLMGNAINAAGLHVCGCFSDWSGWAHTVLPAYLASKRQTCLQFQDEGRKLGSLNIRCMAVQPENKAQCSSVSQRLQRTLACRYLE